MAIVVTRRWTGRGLRKTGGNWSATESWVVTGTGDSGQAEDAAVAHGAVHPESIYLRVFHRDPQATGPLSWIITASYGIDDPKKDLPTPLMQDPIISWDFQRETEPTDRDINDVAIRNSAGDPFDPPLNRFITTGTLRVKRAEPFFNIQKAMTYMNRVNSDAFNIQGVGGLTPGQCYCEMIAPGGDYTLSSPFVWVIYKFKFKPGGDPFQAHPVDEGKWGWWNDSGTVKKGRICDPSGNIVDFDVRLNGAGRPLLGSTYFKVLGAPGGTGDAVPQTAVDGADVPGFVEDPATVDSADITNALWKTVPAVAFAGLL